MNYCCRHAQEHCRTTAVIGMMERGPRYSTDGIASLSLFLTFIYCICVCAHMHVHVSWHTWVLMCCVCMCVKGQLVGVSSLLL